MQDPFQTATLSKTDVSNHSRQAHLVPFWFSVPHYENKIRKWLLLSTLRLPNRGSENSWGLGQMREEKVGSTQSTAFSLQHCHHPFTQTWIPHFVGGGDPRASGASSVLWPGFCSFLSLPEHAFYRCQKCTFLTLALCKGPRSIIWFAHCQAGIHPQSEKRGSTLAC